MTPFHRDMLDYLLCRFQLQPHCPFACRARTNPLFHYSCKASLDAAIAIVSPEPDESFSRLMVIGGGFFKDAIRFASVAMSVELLAQTEIQLLALTLHRNLEYRAVLQRALNNLTLLSAERIKHGEYNVWNHTFLSMVMAETESIEAGTSYGFKVAQSARDSLQTCHDLLQAQMSSASLP